MKSILTLIIVLSVGVVKGQANLKGLNTYGKQNSTKNDTTINIWNSGAVSSNTYYKGWDTLKYDLSQSWYYAYDSAHKTIWKWRYGSDTMYIDQTKITHIIYLK